MQRNLTHKPDLAGWSWSISGLLVTIPDPLGKKSLQRLFINFLFTRNQKDMIVPRKPASIICSPSHKVFQNTTLSGALTSNHGDLGQIYTRWLPNMSECILYFVHNGDKVFHTSIPHFRFGKKYTSPYTSIQKVEVFRRWRCLQVSGSQFPLF